MLVSLTNLNHSATALRRVAIGTAIGVLLAVFTIVAAQAQGTTLSARKQLVTVAVVGDYMANDLGNGMEDLFAHRNRSGVRSMVSVSPSNA